MNEKINKNSFIRVRAIKCFIVYIVVDSPFSMCRKERTYGEKSVSFSKETRTEAKRIIGSFGTVYWQKNRRSGERYNVKRN